MSFGIVLAIIAGCFIWAVIGYLLVGILYQSVQNPIAKSTTHKIISILPLTAWLLILFIVAACI